MKIADCISQFIQEYPLLFKDVDYEKSKLKVLNHIFFKTNNGLKLAKTKNKKEGGYLTYPTYKKNKKGDWIIDIDKPYGEETYKPIPDDYFNSVIYYVYSSPEPIEITLTDRRVYYRYDKEALNSSFIQPKLRIAENLYPFSPYPFYNLTCKDVFLQKDWENEFLFLCNRTLEYFNDENQYKSDNYYPSDKNINITLTQFEWRFEEKGIDDIIKLRKTWGYELKEIIPDYTEIEVKKTNSWINYRQGQIETLTSIINSKK